MHRWVLVITIVITVVMLTTPSSATQILHRSLEELGSDSQLVVQGRVTDVRSYWNEAHTKILTETRVDVDRQFKGSGDDTIAVVQMGGVVDDVRMTVSGALAWRPGEEVVLFLEDSLPQTYRVAGFSQGKFAVERDRNGEVFVRRPLLGVPLVNAKDADREMRLSLDELLRRTLNIREEGGQR